MAFAPRRPPPLLPAPASPNKALPGLLMIALFAAAEYSSTLATRAQWHICPPGAWPVLGQSLLMSSAPCSSLGPSSAPAMFSCGGTPLFSTPGPRGHRLGGQWDAVSGHLVPPGPRIVCYQDAPSCLSSIRFLRTQFHRLVPTQTSSLKQL